MTRDRGLVVAAAVVGAAFWLTIGHVDPAVLRPLADALATDGRAQIGDAELAAIQGRALRVAAAWLAAAALFLLARGLGARAGTPHPSDPGEPARALRGRIARFLREEPGHALLLVAFTLLGALLAAAGLAQPIRCDEAATWLRFVSSSWATPLLTYQTNNHMLYSVLAKLVCASGLAAPACLRAPAFAAGVLAIPASYTAARSHFGREVGILVAGALCTSLLFLDYATNGRSYTLLLLVFALLLALAPRLLAPRGTAAWIAFTGLAALGLWANPVMLYPLAIVGAWLPLRGLQGGDLRTLAGRAGIAVAASVALVLAWYSPAYVARGLTAALSVLDRNPVASAGGEGAASGWLGVIALIRVVWRDWTYGRADAVAWLLLAGAAAGVVVGPTRRACREWWAAITVGIGVLLWGAGAVPPTWIFVFLLPLGLALCFAGALAAVERLAGPRMAATRPLWAIVAAVGLALGGVGAARAPRAGIDAPWYVGYADAEEAAGALRDVLRPRDRIDAHPLATPPLLFYLEQQGLCEGDDAPCLLADGERAPRIYYLDDGSPESTRRLEALRRRLGTAPVLARALSSSRILRFDVAVPPRG